MYTLDALEVEIRRRDSYHHHFHFQASWQQLYLAEACRALGDAEGARAAYASALFQDHRNSIARTALDRLPDTPPALPPYDGLVISDTQFRLGTGAAPSPASGHYDRAMQAWRMGDIASAREGFEAAVVVDETHSNGYCGLGMVCFAQEDHAQARTHFEHAVRLTGAAHDRYHREASAARCARGRHYRGQGELDLAIADFTKALDLHRGNTEALSLRASTYRRKGSDRLAEMDEAALRTAEQ